MRYVFLLLLSICVTSSSHAIENNDDWEAAKVSRNALQNTPFHFSISRLNSWTLYDPGRLSESVLTKEMEQMGDGISLFGGRLFAMVKKDESSSASNGPLIQVFTMHGNQAVSQDDMLSMMLENILANPEYDSKLTLPPSKVNINGRRWTKIGVTSSPKAGANEIYKEYYLHLREDYSAYLARVLVQADQLTLYRNELDRILNSMCHCGRLAQPPYLYR